MFDLIVLIMFLSHEESFQMCLRVFLYGKEASHEESMVFSHEHTKT